jgi:hypothetical protein
MVPALWLAGFDPVGPSILVALVGIATVFLVYHISLNWFSSVRLSLIASFLYAISPVVIKYSNFSWNPNIMPFFSLLFIYFIYQALFKRLYHYLIYATLAFIMVINSHFLGLLLLPIAFIYWLHLIYILYSTKNKHFYVLIRFTLVSIFIFMLSLTPQILFDIKHQGQNFNSIVKFFTERETTVSIKPYKALPLLPQLYDQLITRLVAGKNTLIGPILSILSVLTLLLCFIKSKLKLNFKTPLFLCLLWLFIGLVGLGLYKQHVYDHYFGFIFPVVFIIIAFVFNWLLSQKLILYRVISVLALFTISLFSLLENPFRYSPNKQLSTTKKISQFIVNQSNNKPFNLALLAKQNYDPPYRYLINQNSISLFSLHDKMTEQLFVICEPNKDIDCQPINNPFWDIAAFGWAKIDQQWQIDNIKIFKLVHTRT